MCNHFFLSVHRLHDVSILQLSLQYFLTKPIIIHISLYHIQSQSIVYKTTNTSVMHLVYETFFNTRIVSFIFWWHWSAGPEFQRSVLCIFKVFKRSPWPQSVECLKCPLLKCYQCLCLVFETHRGQVDRQSDITLTAICSLCTSFYLRLCLILLFCFLFRTCSFVKQNRDPISRRSSVCSVHSPWVLLSLTILLSSPLLSSPLLSSPLLSSPLLSSPLLFLFLHLLKAVILSLIFPLCVLVIAHLIDFGGDYRINFL